MIWVKVGMQQFWSALHNKSAFISSFFVLCSTTVPNHYIIKSYIKVEAETNEKQGSEVFGTFMCRCDSLIFQSICSLWYSTLAQRRRVFIYIQHTFPFFNNFFRTFRNCWSGFLWILPEADNKTFMNLAEDIPNVHTFCSTYVIPIPPLLSLNSGGRHRLRKTQEEILTGLD